METVTEGSTTSRDDEAVARFVERFGLVLAESGMPRMPARVFALLLATDDGKCTAGKLADALHASPAAISGAVRYLHQVGLVAKRRDPGERRDHYEIAQDVWYEVYGNRDKRLDAVAQVLESGVDAVGARSPAGQRLAQSVRFFDFMRAELPLLMDKWRAQEPG
jgi:DNA-binding transcriptional regulator GbsR (MarR family)